MIMDLENMNISIKKLKYSDSDLIFSASLIHALSWKRAYSEIVPKSYLDNLEDSHWVKYFTEGLENKNFEVSVLFKNETPVGVITYGKNDHKDMNGFGEIRSLYIHPDHYSKGYGAKLIDYALKALTELGLNKAYLFTFENNYRARKFYERLGFTYRGRESSFDIDGTTFYDVKYIIENDSIKLVD